MVIYDIYFSKRAEKDKKLVKQAGLERKVRSLLQILKENSYRNSPPYEKKVRNLNGVISRRINLKHRLIYQIYEGEKAIKVIHMWSHYDDMQTENLLIKLIL